MEVFKILSSIHAKCAASLPPFQRCFHIYIGSASLFPQNVATIPVKTRATIHLLVIPHCSETSIYGDFTIFFTIMLAGVTSTLIIRAIRLFNNLALFSFKFIISITCLFHLFTALWNHLMWISMFLRSIQLLPLLILALMFIWWCCAHHYPPTSIISFVSTFRGPFDLEPIFSIIWETFSTWLLTEHFGLHQLSHSVGYRA